MPTRVVHLLGSFHQGGTERQAVQLVQLLHTSGRHRVVVASLDPTGPLRSEVDSLGIEVLTFPLTSFHDRNTATQLARLVRMLKEFGADVVQTHDYYTNMFGMLAAVLARRPARIASLREVRGVRTSFQRQLERSAFLLADAVVINAEAVRRQLLAQRVAGDKIVLIPNALDPARLAPIATGSRAQALACVGLPAHIAPPIVTIVANMRHAVKDQETFLRAAQRVRREHPATVFVLAGEGPRRPALEALAAELNLAASVFFVGTCRAVGDLLALSSVCVLSSRSEGLPNAILEYMAASRPVVATNVGGAAELVIDGVTGYLVAAGNDAALAERIVHLLRNPDAASAMGARGQQDVQQHFSPDAMLRRTEALYARLLARRGA